MAHGRGGYCVNEIQETFYDQFYDQLGKVATVNSRMISWVKLSNDRKHFMKHNSIHYQPSMKPKGENSVYLGEFRSETRTCPHVSVGSPVPEETVGLAWTMIQD